MDDEEKYLEKKFQTITFIDDYATDDDLNMLEYLIHKKSLSLLNGRRKNLSLEVQKKE